MKKFALIFSLAIVLLAMASCGQRKPDLWSEKDQKENTASAEPEDLDEAMDNLGRALEDVAENLKITDEVVNYRDLLVYMPRRLAGLDLQDTDGETGGAFGFKFSQAEGYYGSREDESLKVEIIDAAGIASIMLRFADWSDVEFDREDENGFERTTEFEGFKAFEKYNKRRNDSELAVIVADRFVFSFEGDDMDMEKVKRAARQMKLERFERKES
jgi:hypothetical protein